MNEVIAISIFVSSCSIAILIPNYLNTINKILKLTIISSVIALGSLFLLYIITYPYVIMCWMIASLISSIFKLYKIQNISMVNYVKPKTYYEYFIKPLNSINILVFRIYLQIGIPTFIIFIIRYYSTPIEIWIVPLLNVNILLLVASSSYAIFSNNIKHIIVTKTNLAEYVIGTCIGIIAMQFVPI